MTNDKLSLLVEAVATRRDRQAFSALFGHFAPRLKGFAMNRGVSAAVAEDLVQETMLTVWRKADSFDSSRASVPTWIFTIVRNKRIDLFRRETYPEVELEQAAEQPDDSQPSDERTELAELTTHLHHAMQTLPSEQKAILQQAFFEEKSHRAIAADLGIPLGTVKSRIRLAVNRLRDALPEEHR